MWLLLLLMVLVRVLLLRMEVRMLLKQSRMQVLQRMLLMQLKVLLLLLVLLMLTCVPVDLGVLSRRGRQLRRKGGIQYFAVLLLELSQQFGVLPLGSFVLVVLVVVGVGR